MTRLAIPIGISSFRKVRAEEYFYIDKTIFIEKFLSKKPAEVTLFTRPRRFGKSLTLSMLKEFLDINSDCLTLFNNLYIVKNKNICSEWMNKHPVILLNLKDVRGKSFSKLYSLCANIMMDICSEHMYLLDSQKVLESDKIRLQKIIRGSMEDGLLERSLHILCRALSTHWGEQAILLIDEYDVPFAVAEEYGYYPDLAEFMRVFLSSALKENAYLQFAVMTGCLRIARERIFTGLNNVLCDSVSDNRFAECFGFTDKEVESLLVSVGMAHTLGAVRDWYDGYRFGDSRAIYCPWDVLNYVEKLQDSPCEPPRSYWRHSSGNAIIRRLLAIAGRKTRESLGALVSGRPVSARLAENLSYDELYASEQNIWTVLYCTGYLTRAAGESTGSSDALPCTGGTALRIPNLEIKELFQEELCGWFAKQMGRENREALFKAFWEGDERTCTSELSRMLMKTVSYFAYDEKFYQGMVAGMFFAAGFEVTPEKESGTGRPDVVVEMNDGPDVVAIIELKNVKNAKDMLEAAHTAHEQITRNRYCEPWHEKGFDVIRWAFVFCGKECLASCGK